MRVRLLSSGDDSLLVALLPAEGRVLHTESNRGEWAIVALDAPVSVSGSVAEMLWVRPATVGGQVGGVAAILVHIAAVTGVSKVEGRPVYKLGPLLGQGICEGEGDA